MKKTFAATLVAACALGATVSQAATPEVEALLQAAQKEGAVYSVGMPNTWANWVKTWNDLQTKYKIKTQDTDMASAEQISKFMAEGENATSDIGDVGFEFGEIAKKRGITMPYKPSTWDQIPGWAKDPDGHWCLAYTGTVAFIINKELVKDIPRTWSDLLKGTYRVSVGAVGSAAQANYSVLAAAIAFGGDEKNLNPAYDFFAKIAKQGRLSMVDPVVANLEKGEVEVGMLWDFNALNYRDQIDRNRFEVVIPSEGSVIFSGMIRCPECNRLMRSCQKSHRSGNVYRYYHCEYHSTKMCGFAKVKSENLIEEMLLNRVDIFLAEREAAMSDQKSEKKHSTNNVSKYRAELDRLNTMFLKGRISEEYYDTEYLRLNDLIGQYEASRQSHDSVKHLQEVFVSDWKEMYKDLDKLHQKFFWRDVIRQIIVDDNMNVIDVIFL